MYCVSISHLFWNWLKIIIFNGIMLVAPFLCSLSEYLQIIIIHFRFLFGCDTIFSSNTNKTKHDLIYWSELWKEAKNFFMRQEMLRWSQPALCCISDFIMQIVGINGMFLMMRLWFILMHVATTWSYFEVI